VQNQLNCGEVRSSEGRTRARRRRKILTGIDMDTDYKSRTRKKNEDRALQRLGEQLVALPFGQLETMELPDELLTAINKEPWRPAQADSVHQSPHAAYRPATHRNRTRTHPVGKLTEITRRPPEPRNSNLINSLYSVSLPAIP